MEIRCSECGFVGKAAEVRPTDGGFGLVCAQCNHVNVASVSDGQGRDGEVAPKQADTGESSEEGPSPAEEFVSRSLERLLPEPGEGRRCPKCVHLLDDDSIQHCTRCGLSLAESEKYEEGEAPWEQVGPTQEEVLAEARRLWRAVLDEDRSEQIEDFVDFVIANELIDFGIRRIQHFIVEHGENRHAVEGLRRLAKSLHVAVEVARGRAAKQADAFNEDVKRFRTGLLVGALVFWTVILLLFSWLFWDKF